MLDRVRRQPGIALFLLALVAAALLYAPTLACGLTNYDDPWLVRDNWILQHASWSALHTVFFDLHSPDRFVLSPEYLPVRDLSIMLDYAVWGSWFPGFHLTNLVLYLAAIALFFALLDGFGIDRTVAGLAALVWAVHPAHAESVAWITERKGLLGALFALLAGVAYARFRAGRSTRWLALAMLAAVCAVWSKAPAAFAIAAIAGLELLLPARRVSWRRSLFGLGAIAAVGLAAFVPVVMMASGSAVVGTATITHGGRLATVLGVHGFYLELAALAIPNAASYPIATLGPTVVQLVLGALGLAVIAGAAAVPRVPGPLRASAMLWLVTWLPVSHLILPLQMVIVADRYALLPTLGFALALGHALAGAGPRVRLRAVLAAVICVAAALRTLDAQSTWESPRALWTRAVESNPDDLGAWTMLADAYADDGEPALAMAAVTEGRTHGDSARLDLREALLALARGDKLAALPAMRRAAEGGEPKAMANLALLEQTSQPEDALAWAKKAVAAEPLSAHALRTLGKVALAAHPDEALPAFALAYHLEPSADNRFNLGLGYLVLHRAAEALPLLEASVDDPHLAAAARDALAEAHRQLATP